MITDTYNEIKYLGDKKFKVVQRLDNKGRERKGVLLVGKGVEWNKDSEQNNRIDKIEFLKLEFNSRLQKESCFCQFPRIVDYVTHRAYYDSVILRDIIIKKLEWVTHKDLGGYQGDSIYRCHNCNSEYVLLMRINPHGDQDIAGFKQVKDSCENKMGSKIQEWVPVAIMTPGPSRDGDSVENLIQYLFETE